MVRVEPRILALTAVKAYVLLSRAASAAGCTYALMDAVEGLLLGRRLSWTCILLGCIMDDLCSMDGGVLRCGPGARATIKSLYMLYGVIHPEHILCADGVYIVLDPGGVDGVKKMLEDCIRTHVAMHARLDTGMDTVLDYVYRMVDSVHKEMGSSCTPV